MTFSINPSPLQISSADFNTLLQYQLFGQDFFRANHGFGLANSSGYLGSNGDVDGGSGSSWSIYPTVLAGGNLIARDNANFYNKVRADGSLQLSNQNVFHDTTSYGSIASGTPTYQNAGIGYAVGSWPANVPTRQNHTVPSIDWAGCSSTDPVYQDMMVNQSVQNSIFLMDARNLADTVVDYCLASISGNVNGYKVLVQHEAWQVVRVFVQGTITAGHDFHMGFSTDGITLASASDYKGTVLVYSSSGVNITGNRAMLMGSFVTPTAWVFQHDGNLTGQLIAKSISISDNFDAAEFKYVPFDPPIIDPSALAGGSIAEGGGLQSLGLSLDKPAIVDVSGKFFFILKSAVADAAIADFSPTPIAVDPASAVSFVIPAGQTVPAVLPQVTPFDDLLNEGDENFYLVVFDLLGAVLANNQDTMEFSITLVDDDYNTAPVGVDDVASTDEDLPLNIASSVLLSNDGDVDGDPLTLTKVFAATNGTASFSGGVVTFTPAANLNSNGTSPFSFRYELSDGNGGLDTAEVLLTVALVNDGPPVSLADTLNTIEDQAVDIFAATLLSNDTDPDGDVLTLTRVFATENGSVSLSAGTVSFVPDANLNSGNTAGFSFLYEVSDGQGGLDTGHVEVLVSAVNDAPLVGDQSFSVAENSSSGTLVGVVLVMDSDNSSWTFVLSGTDASLFKVGSDGAIRVAADADLDFETTPLYTLQIAVSDGGSSVAAELQISLLDVNEAPVLNVDSFSVTENIPAGLVIGTVGGVDPENDDLIYTLLNAANLPFEVNPVTGGLSLRLGENLDFESLTTYDLQVSVSDGQYSDSRTIVVHVTNVIENADLKITLADDGDKSWVDPDTLWTASSALTVVWVQDGDTLSDVVNLKNGKNRIVQEYCPVEKDECGRDTLLVWMNDVVPEIRWITEDSLWINHSDFPLVGIVTWVDAQGEVQKDSLFSSDLLVEGENHPVLSFTDPYGNRTVSSRTIFLDTQAPLVEIISPEGGDRFDQPVVRVEWSVDGELQTDGVLESLREGNVWIIRTFTDRAGNTGRDSVPVRLDLGDADVRARMERPLVSLEEGVVDDFMADLPEDVREDLYFVSIMNQSDRTEELLQSGRAGVQNVAEGSLVPGSTGDRHVFPTLLVEVRFPQIGGLDAAGNPRGGLLEGSSAVRGIGGEVLQPGDAIWKLSLETELFVFDNIGQFVEKFRFELDVSKAKYLDDQGVVHTFVQLRPHTLDKRLWATGVFLIKGLVRGVATLQIDTDRHKAGFREINTRSILSTFGFQRTRK